MESKEDHQCTYSTYTERNSIPVSSSIISKFDSYFRHTRDRYSYIWRKAGLLFQNFPLRHVWILVPRMIWYLSTYIERNSIPVSSSTIVSYQNSTPTFAILGIGIPTFGERWGFCFQNFQLRRLVFLLAFLLD